MFLLLRKGQFGEKLEKKVEIFLIFLLIFLRFKKAISYHLWYVAFSPDGKTLASGSEDRTVKLWDVETGEELTSLKGHQSWVRSVAFSPDGEILASGGGDGTIRLWDLKNKKEFALLRGHQDWVWSLTFSPDGKTLASGSADDTIRLWDVSLILKSPTEILQEAEEFTGLTTRGFSIVSSEVVLSP